MAQNLLPPIEGFRSYHTNRAVAQADVAGGFAQQPRAWRFVVLRLVPGRPLDFTAEQRAMICLDHVNCLYRLRQCEVGETIALDRRHEHHVGLAKFLIEAERAPEVAPGEGREAFARLAERVRAVMGTAFVRDRCSSIASSTRR